MKASRTEISKLSRLRKQAAFDRLRSLRDSEHRWTAKSLSLQVVSNTDDEKPHVGISVSRKTAKRSVDRNRIKRRLRAAVASALPSISKSHHHYLISGRIDALTRSFEELQTDLVWCLKKLNP